MIDILEHFGFIGYLEASPKLRYVEDIVEIRQFRR
jgi:hypothetical protein